MNLAYIIVAHQFPETLVRLVDRLDSEGVFFFVHINQASEEMYQESSRLLADRPNVIFVERQKIKWGDNGLVRAILAGIKSICDSGLPIDYTIDLSGQDYPIKSNAFIKQELAKCPGKQLMEYFPLPREEWGASGGLFRIERYYFWLFGKQFRYPPANMAWLPAKKRKLPHGYLPYGGSAWWCLTRDCLEYLNEFVQSPVGQDILRFYDHTFASPEMFFQTVLMNSEMADTVLFKDLWAIRWEKGSARPLVWKKEHLDILKSSERLFARKFDHQEDSEILDLLDTEVLAQD